MDFLVTKTMKKTILILSILFLITACNSDDSEEQTTPVSYSLVFHNYVSGSEGDKKSNLVVKTDAEWDIFLANPKIKGRTYEFSETEIDFTKYQIIAIFDEMHPYNGYFVDIKEVREGKSTITIYLEYKNIVGFATVLTQPLTIAKIPKTNKKIVFKS